MFAIILMKFDYGSMARYERNAVEKGDLFTVNDINADTADAAAEGSDKGITMDLILPVIILVVSCVIGMIHTGGFFEGESFVNSFANSDATVGLPVGSIVALVIIVIYFLCRGTITFKESMSCVPEGMKEMASPILVLTLAWALNSMTGSLGLSEYVEGLVKGMNGAVIALIPAALFAIACALAFSSGTSWGTFGMLIPIGLAITKSQPELTMPILAACMAGAVYGDHCSPISDTTIMASAGASCDHLSHVTTQLPYATTVAVVSLVSYVVAGITKNPILPLIVGIALLIGVLFFFKGRENAYVVGDDAGKKE